MAGIRAHSHGIGARNPSVRTDAKKSRALSLKPAHTTPAHTTPALEEPRTEAITDATRAFDVHVSKTIDELADAAADAAETARRLNSIRQAVADNPSIRHLHFSLRSVVTNERVFIVMCEVFPNAVVPCWHAPDYETWVKSASMPMLDALVQHNRSREHNITAQTAVFYSTDHDVLRHIIEQSTTSESLMQLLKLAVYLNKASAVEVILAVCERNGVNVVREYSKLPALLERARCVTGADAREIENMLDAAGCNIYLDTAFGTRQSIKWWSRGFMDGHGRLSADYKQHMQQLTAAITNGSDLYASEFIDEMFIHMFHFGKDRVVAPVRACVDNVTSLHPLQSKALRHTQRCVTLLTE